MELNTYFDGLLGNIEPDAEHTEKAKKSHQKLREQLESDEEISKANPDTYLSGSYARDTAINNIKDVDIIMTIDLDYTITLPDIVISWLQRRLYDYYTEVNPQGRSVQVITDSGFQLDVVPATLISNPDGPVWIPDRDVQKWVPSHPKGQINFATERNKSTDDYYKHLVKIMKFWRDRIINTNAQVKSYILESLIAECLAETPISYASAVVDIFRCIYEKYKAYLDLRLVPKIKDPGYPSVNVAKRWEFNEFSAFLNEIQSSYEIAKDALSSEDEEKSIQLWKKLFGSKFMPRE